MAGQGAPPPCSTTCSDPMLQCCTCEKLLEDPQLLRCLHNCCRACLQQNDDLQQANAGFTSALTTTCPKCDEISETGSNGFMESRVRRHRAIAAASSCGMCAADAEDARRPAEVWCPTCLMSFCDTCVLWHGRFHKTHATNKLDGVSNWDDVSPPLVPLCGAHLKAFHIACFTCKASRCPDCWVACGERRHDVQHLGSPTVASHVMKVKGLIDNLECALLKKTEDILRPRMRVEADLRLSLEADLERLRRRKLRLLAAIDGACIDVERRLRDAHDGLRATAAVMGKSAAKMEQKVRQAAGYGRYVVEADLASELINHEGALIARMTLLSANLDELKQPMAASQCLAFESTLPDDDDQLAELANLWIGTPLVTTDDLCTRTPALGVQTTAAVTTASSLHSTHSFSTVTLPVAECRDVSATEVGSLLLAAGEAGLLEYSMSGRGGPLSRWLPPKTRHGQSNQLLAVESLNDGRAAVGAASERLVVLLRRVEGKAGGAGSAGSTWTEDRRVSNLSGPPLSLSAHDDTLVVGSAVGSGAELAFVNSSAGCLIGVLKCSYVVASIALTDLLIVTASSSAVRLDDGKRTYVVDAHMRISGRRLWRCALSGSSGGGGGGGGEVWDVCADATGRMLHVTARRSHDTTEGESAQLITLSAADGSVLRSDAIGIGARLPLDKLLLTISKQQMVLAVSCASSLHAT